MQKMAEKRQMLFCVSILVDQAHSLAQKLLLCEMMPSFRDYYFGVHSIIVDEEMLRRYYRAGVVYP